tara:strand:+ start:1778 stop:1966 length:189 start_codon:yes stop_codon:yes gene_type:complete
MKKKDPIKCAPHWSKEHTLNVKRGMLHILYEWERYDSSELPPAVRSRVRFLIDAVLRMEASQ